MKFMWKIGVFTTIFNLWDTEGANKTAKARNDKMVGVIMIILLKIQQKYCIAFYFYFIKKNRHKSEKSHLYVLKIKKRSINPLPH